MSDPQAVLDQLATEPDWFPHQLDLAGRRALLLNLPSEALRGAAFLDERASAATREGFWIGLAPLLRAAAPAAGCAPQAIFHIGHCGSTLLSRLLDGLPGARGLREPLPLRTLAELYEELPRATARMDRAQWDELFAATLALLARRPEGIQHAVVKATSNCNALIGPWLGRHRESRAVLLSVGLRSYLATILKAPGARADCARFAPARLAYLHQALGDERLRLHHLDDGGLVALGWLAEGLRFAQAHHEFPTRTLALEFDALLKEPRATLAQVAAHLGLNASPAEVERALDPAVMGTYAKAPEHEYDAAARAADLAESVRRFGAEITSGLAFAQAQITRYPALGLLAERVHS